MCEIMEGQVSLCDLGIWSGKMSQEPSQAEPQKEQISPPSLKKQPKSSAKKSPLFLSLKTDGPRPDASAEWVTAESPFPSLGNYTTVSFGECPNAAVDSRLSQILEASPPQKFSLSAKACEGILRRAEKRGKELPKELHDALVRQASVSDSEDQGGR